MMLDGFHHLGADKKTLERRIVKSKKGAHQSREKEKQRGGHRVSECFAEDAREIHAIKSYDAPPASLASRIEQVVGAAQQLIQRSRQALLEGIFAYGRQIGGGLTV